MKRNTPLLSRTANPTCEVAIFDPSREVMHMISPFLSFFSIPGTLLLGMWYIGIAETRRSIAAMAARTAALFLMYL
jgi:hypothetical protein